MLLDVDSSDNVSSTFRWKAIGEITDATSHQLVVTKVWFYATVARHANYWSYWMTHIDALRVHKLGNSSASKACASVVFQMWRREERVVSIQSPNESSQTADPPERQYLRVGSLVNVFGSRC